MTISPSLPGDVPDASRRARSPVVWQVVSLVLFFGIAGAVPLGLRALNRATGTAAISESYFPSILAPRERKPFYAEAVEGFRRTAPDFVVIGDSMGGSRIHHRRLGELAGRGVVPVFEPATGSVFWYLAFKNWVVAAGIHPKAVIVFFRDENLTDPMFRLNLDAIDRVAHEREPEVDAILAANARGPFFRVHGLLEQVYGFDRTRAWLEPRLAAAPVSLAAGPRGRARLLERMNEEVFSLAALRPMVAADMAFGDPDKFDFHKNLPTSILPSMIRLARQAGVRPAFVRVQRRPVNGQPPMQSEALQRYIHDLRTYLEANGAYFHDEWGDPELPLSIYSDGDHIGGQYRVQCTELFFRRNQALFR